MLSFIMSMLKSLTMVTLLTMGVIGCASNNKDASSVPIYTPIKTTPSTSTGSKTQEIHIKGDRTTTAQQATEGLIYNTQLSSLQMTLNGKTYQMDETIDWSKFGQGLNVLDVSIQRKGTVTNPTNSAQQIPFTEKATGQLYVYNTPNATMILTKGKQSTINSSVQNTSEEDKAPSNMTILTGNITPKETLEKMKNKFTYNGIALTNLGKDEGGQNAKLEQGQFKYTVDFANRTGSGEVTGLSLGQINLQKGNFEYIFSSSPEEGFDPRNQQALSVVGDAHTNSRKDGFYFINFFGNQAEEVGGLIEFDSINNDRDIIDIGIHGKR